MDPTFDVLNLSDPGFPTGAHGHSAGLEYAIQEGWVVDGPSLRAWCQRALVGSVMTLDLRAAIKAWYGNSWVELNRELASFRTSRVQREASAQVGRSFLRSVAGCYGDRIGELPGSDDPDAVQFSVAWGTVFRLLDLPVKSMAQTFLFGVLRQWTQVAVRIVPLGQKEAFAVQTDLLAALEVVSTGPEVARLPLESGAFGLEIAGLGMENLQRKYFRS